MCQRPHILRQTRAAEWIPRLQIVRRQVELGIATKQRHDALRVYLQFLANATDLVCKNNLRRVESIAGVLHHLGRGPVYNLRILSKKRERQILWWFRPVVCADYRQRWVLEICHRGALAQEFRKIKDPELSAGLEV